MKKKRNVACPSKCFQTPRQWWFFRRDNAFCVAKQPSPMPLLLSSEKTRPIVARQVLLMMMMAASKQEKAQKGEGGEEGEERGVGERKGQKAEERRDKKRSEKGEKEKGEKRGRFQDHSVNTREERTAIEATLGVMGTKRRIDKVGKSDKAPSNDALISSSRASSTLLSNQCLMAKSESRLKIDHQLICQELLRMHRVGRRLCVD